MLTFFTPQNAAKNSHWVALKSIQAIHQAFLAAIYSLVNNTGGRHPTSVILVLDSTFTNMRTAPGGQMLMGRRAVRGRSGVLALLPVQLMSHSGNARMVAGDMGASGPRKRSVEVEVEVEGLYLPLPHGILNLNLNLPHGLLVMEVEVEVSQEIDAAPLFKESIIEIVAL